VQNILGLTGIRLFDPGLSNLDRWILIGWPGNIWRLGRWRWTPAATAMEACGGGLVVKSRIRDSDHDFGSSLAWEKESEEGNAFRGLERGAGGRGRRMTVRCGTAVTASKRHGWRGRGKGEAGRRGHLPQRGTPAAARSNKGAARRRR
jgi:hypothetical protein